MGRISRRKFIKNSITTSASLSLTGFGLFSPVFIQPIRCKQCNFDYDFLLQSDKTHYCPHRGANLHNGKILANTSCDFSCLNHSKSTRKPACSQVPFPNYAVTLKTDKPYLNLSALRF